MDLNQNNFPAFPSNLPSPRPIRLLVPLTGCPRAQQLSAYLASLLLEALQTGDAHLLDSALLHTDFLRLQQTDLDPVSAERLDLLEALAAVLRSRANTAVHTRLLEHLARPLLEFQPPASG